MATLLEKANQILDEKNTKLLPENLKAGDERQRKRWNEFSRTPE